ncbi:MAG: hypothetical protein F6J98_46260, partial [Moorea sp. SIO4G2]|nr:hypothetical protein [Moorena sp. SIO4G2]
MRYTLVFTSSLLPAPCSLLPKNPKFVPHKSYNCYILISWDKVFCFLRVLRACLIIQIVSFVGDSFRHRKQVFITQSGLDLLASFNQLPTERSK